MARPDTRNRSSRDEELVERPPWLIPLLVILGVIAFSGFFLWYYVGPTTDEILGLTPQATDRLDDVNVSIGAVQLAVPANYTRFAGTRAGGAQERLEMHALLPDLTPFREDLRMEFESSEPLSRVVHMTIEEAETVLSARRRLDLIYLPKVTTQRGEPGPHGLRHYVFRNDTGLAGQDMYVGDGPAGAPALFICASEAPLLWCRREILLTEHVVLRYRFKRAYLEDWKEIDEKVIALIARFRERAKPDTPPEDMRLKPAK